MTYRVSYFDSQDNVYVGPEAARDLGAQDALQVFARLASANSFIGIDLSASSTLQILTMPDGTRLLELLDRAKSEALQAAVNTPMAERAIMAVYAGDVDLRDWGKEFFFVKWKRARVKPNTSPRRR
jgi:hypothetical protein